MALILSMACPGLLFAAPVILEAQGDSLAANETHIVTLVAQVTPSSLEETTVVPKLQLPTGWEAVVPLEPVELKGGQSQILLFPIRIPTTAPAGTYEIPLSLSTTEDRFIASISYAVRIAEERGLSAHLLSAPTYATGESYTAEFQIRNTGNVAEQVFFQAKGNSNLKMQVEPEEALLEPGSSIIVTVRTLLESRQSQSSKHVLHLVGISAKEPVLEASASATTTIVATEASSQGLYRRFPLTLTTGWRSKDNAATLYYELQGDGDAFREGVDRLAFRLTPGTVNVSYTWPGFTIDVGRLSLAAPPIAKPAELADGVRLRFGADDSSWLLGAYQGAKGLSGLATYRRKQTPQLQLTWGLLSSFAKGEHLLGFGGEYQPRPAQSLKLDFSLDVSRDSTPWAVSFEGRLGRETAMSATASYQSRRYLKRDGAKAAFSLRQSFGTGLLRGLSLSSSKVLQQPDGKGPFAASSTRNSISLHRQSGANTLSLSFSDSTDVEDAEVVQALNLRGIHSFSESWQGNAGIVWQQEGTGHDKPKTSETTYRVGLQGLGELSVINGYFETATAAIDQWRYGLGLQWNYSGKRTNCNFGLEAKDLEQKLWTVNLAWQRSLAGGQRISFSGLLQNDGSEQLETKAQVEYAVPLGVPVARRAGVGVVTGRIVDAKDTGLPGVIVMAAGVVAATQANGEYTLIGVPFGTHYVVLDSFGTNPALLTVPTTPLPIEVSSKEVSVPDIALVPAASLSGKVRVMPVATGLSSDVLYPTFSPEILEAAQVELVGEGGRLETTLAADGSFTFKHLSPGTWRLRLLGLEDYPLYTWQPREITLELKAGEEGQAEFSLTPIPRRINLMEGGTVRPDE